MKQELEPYSEVERDLVEERLLAESGKPEIHWEYRDGLDIHVFYLRKLGTVSMALLMGRGEQRTCREFPIPNDKVNDAIRYPERYANAMGMYRE